MPLLLNFRQRRPAPALRPLPPVRRRAVLPWITVAALLAGALFGAGFPAPAQAFWVYMSEEEAVAIAFPKGERVVRVDLEAVIEPEKRLDTERQLRFALVLAEMKCFQGSRDGKILAYACIDNVIGRYKPITFMVKIEHPTGKLAWYEILVYRELVGNSSRHGPFREQFLGKTIASKLKYGDDLRMLAGATMTSDHLVDAFRKHFHLYRNHLAALPLQPSLTPEHFKERGDVRMMR